MVSQTIQIEVAYATVSHQQIIALDVPVGTTVKQAISLSNIAEFFSDIEVSSDNNANKVGIFSQIVDLETVVQSGERIEIYRPLLIDPRLARFERVRQSKK
jgi:putative ubiquitin-RnfH superfamily antitoxin RatB of RatAB toxin-antitoxin module